MRVKIIDNAGREERWTVGDEKTILPQHKLDAVPKITPDLVQPSGSQRFLSSEEWYSMSAKRGEQEKKVNEMLLHTKKRRKYAPEPSYTSVATEPTDPFSQAATPL